MQDLWYSPIAINTNQGLARIDSSFRVHEIPNCILDKYIIWQGQRVDGKSETEMWRIRWSIGFLIHFIVHYRVPNRSKVANWIEVVLVYYNSATFLSRQFFKCCTLANNSKVNLIEIRRVVREGWRLQRYTSPHSTKLLLVFIHSTCQLVCIDIIFVNIECSLIEPSIRDAA